MSLTPLQSAIFWLSTLMIVMLIGYFTMGGVDGALAALLIYLVMSLTTFIALIPFVGIFLQWWVCTQYVLPWLFIVTRTHESLLTTGILIYVLIIGVLFWVITTMVAVGVIIAVSDHRNRM